MRFFGLFLLRKIDNALINSPPFVLCGLRPHLLLLDSANKLFLIVGFSSIEMRYFLFHGVVVGVFGGINIVLRNAKGLHSLVGRGLINIGKHPFLLFQLLLLGLHLQGLLLLLVLLLTACLFLLILRVLQLILLGDAAFVDVPLCNSGIQLIQRVRFSVDEWFGLFFGSWFGCRRFDGFRFRRFGRFRGLGFRLILCRRFVCFRFYWFRRFGLGGGNALSAGARVCHEIQRLQLWFLGGARDVFVGSRCRGYICRFSFCKQL